MPIDVLMVQVGTPDAPTPKALRKYLREFLSDPRVLEMPALRRWLLVHLVVVPFRSPRSAAKYRRIWDPASGSPLLANTRRQQEALGQALGPGFRVHFAMRYGNPSVARVVQSILGQGCTKLVVLPMFPQYCAATTASGADVLFGELQAQRVLPALRLIGDYHDDPGYLDAVASRIRSTIEEARRKGFEPQMNLLSFHGIPVALARNGDPYPERVHSTARGIVERMGWSSGQWQVVFQSRFGRAQWLEPYTDQTLRSLARQGVKTVLVAQPGFTADCLETIDEIGHEAALEFRAAGGQALVRVPCLNDTPEFISALRSLVERESAGW